MKKRILFLLPLLLCLLLLAACGKDQSGFALEDNVLYRIASDGSREALRDFSVDENGLDTTLNEARLLGWSEDGAAVFVDRTQHSNNADDWRYQAVYFWQADFGEFRSYDAGPLTALAGRRICFIGDWGGPYLSLTIPAGPDAGTTTLALLSEVTRSEAACETLWNEGDILCLRLESGETVRFDPVSQCRLGEKESPPAPLPVPPLDPLGYAIDGDRLLLYGEELCNLDTDVQVRYDDGWIDQKGDYQSARIKAAGPYGVLVERVGRVGGAYQAAAYLSYDFLIAPDGTQLSWKRSYFPSGSSDAMLAGSLLCFVSQKPMANQLTLACWDFLSDEARELVLEEDFGPYDSYCYLQDGGTLYVGLSRGRILAVDLTACSLKAVLREGGPDEAAITELGLTGDELLYRVRGQLGGEPARIPLP